MSSRNFAFFSPPSTTYFPHETRKAACISAASDAQPRSLSLLRGQRKHALRPLHNREYAANCPLSVARTHRFRHRKSPDSDTSFERDSGPVLPWRRAHGPSRLLPGQHKKGKRRVCHGFHGSSSSQDAGLPLVLRATPQMQPDAVEDPLLSPGITGYKGAWRSPFAQESERQRAGSRGNASRVPACKLLFARTEPIRSAPVSRAGSGRGPWQPQALS